MQRNTQQNKALYYLMTRLRIDKDMRGFLALQYSNQRTNSIKELSYSECAKLLDDLQAQNNAISKQEETKAIRRKRSKVLFLAVELGLSDRKGCLDWERFNNFMLKTSKYKKHLKEYTNVELNDLITQLEQIQKKSGKIAPCNHKTPEEDGI
jgi:hypothetical protein